LRLRYKEPGEDESLLIERPVTDADAVERFADAGREVRFSVQVAGFAQLLRGDPYIGGEYDWDTVIGLAGDALGPDTFGYRAEFLELVERARDIGERPAKP
jgi:Ca-activated chloride channel family protein